MANTEKTAKLSFSTILPAAAVALAALSLVFTFLIGVNVYGEATQTHYIKIEDAEDITTVADAVKFVEDQKNQ